MKEDNLLIFRDYQIKIGDFGISIKMNEGNTENEYYLKGYTAGYINQKTKYNFSNQVPFTRE